ncbi:fasciclin domain-containing protein [Hydrotalea sp.]|uniref:fasciclin domain-containing protein n=1 Tax=Hydrotalea sp. TaxID=2881279 RepID=UPI003D14A1B2
MKNLLLKKTFTLSLLASAIILLGSACKKSSNNPSTNQQTITTIVSNNANFSLLKTAVLKANLATTLNGTGPFTVFAPSDTAFAGSGITASVINSLTASQLNTLLLYHTIPANIPAANVPAGPNAKVITASGDSVFVTKNANGVFINGIPVTQADIMASNGVIHAIARVLIPPVGNIVQVAQSDTSFSYLVAAVLRASQGSVNVAAVLSGPGPFTVFAPTNAAFRAAGFATVNDINNADPATLTSILTYHVIGARVFSSDLTQGAQPTTLNSEKLTISLTGGATVKGNGNTVASNIIATNIMATNGVVHVIDRVLLP